MALRAAYEAFLRAPSSAALAEDAGLHYITSLTSVEGPAIVDHLKKQALQFKTIESNVLSSFETSDSLVLEIGTTFEFLTAGGAILLQLDDNLLADRKTHVPIFSSGKIQQIRQYWDQSTLLKQVEVIGKRGANWPVKDGAEQAKLVKTSVSAGKVKQPDVPLQTPSKVNPTRDPHGSLSLFAPRRDDEEDTVVKPYATPATSARPPPRDYGDLFVGSEESTPSAPKTSGPVKPYATPATSARPPPRDYGDLFVGSDNETTPSGSVPEPRAESPSKRPNKNVSKQFQPIRLFDQQPEEAPARTSVVTNPKQYNHFEFGDGEDAAANAKPPTPPKKVNASSWDFEDFTTPAKPVPKIRGNDVRHFGWSDDEEIETPVMSKKVAQPRRDAEAHFEFTDESPQKEDIQQKRGSMQNTGLYDNHIYGEQEKEAAPHRQSHSHNTMEGHHRNFDSQFLITDDKPEGVDKVSKPLATVTNATMNGHRRAFDSQFTLTDESPSMKENKAEPKKAMAGDRQAAVNMMDSSWDNYESPAAGQPKKENMPIKAKTSIKTESDGMGGRAGQSRLWGFGDSDPEDEIPEKKKVRDPAQTAAKGGGFWDFE